MSIVKLSNNGVKNATAFGSISSLGSMTFIKKLTASSSGTLSFVNGASSVVLDSTYKEYVFTLNNIHPETDGQKITFQSSTNTGSSYGVTATSSAFDAEHSEGGATSFSYNTSGDLAQGTAYQPLSQNNVGNDNDQNAVGILHLFNPSSTTFVKHFIYTGSSLNSGDYLSHDFVAGYFNTTSAVDAIQFKMESGNIDAGDICLYGIA
jgi:hypothetical protein